ncbi:hypothetical protein JCM18750_35770 [Halostagnicola bangensis]
MLNNNSLHVRVFPSYCERARDDPVPQARAYLERFVFYFTPERGSWLNMAEIELGVLKRQCLDRRIYHAATPGGGRCVAGSPQRIFSVYRVAIHDY